MLYSFADPEMANSASSIWCNLGRNSVFPEFHDKTSYVSLPKLAVLSLCPGFSVDTKFHVLVAAVFSSIVLFLHN